MGQDKDGVDQRSSSTAAKHLPCLTEKLSSDGRMPNNISFRFTCAYCDEI
jgi:hypothetical protein